MAVKHDKSGRRRLTPRDALRRFFEPKPSRRQVLRGFVVGAASIGCSSNEGEADPADQAEPKVTDESQPPTVDSSNRELPGGSATDDMVTPVLAPEPQSADPAPTTPAVPEPVTSQTPQPQASSDAEEPSPVMPEEPAPARPTASVTMGRSAYDMVELGATGIVTSRLAMGSGTTGFDGSSAQTRMGAEFTDLLVQGYERGIRFFETADAYGSHRLVGDAIKQVGRQNVTVLTKTMAETREEAEADLDRFMEELGTDMLDIVLLHIRTSATWTTESQGAMQALAEAKAAGRIRAHGVSCHTLDALELAAKTDWVEVDLARINPYRLHMDADPDTVKGVLDGMKAAGKGVIGMKILGQGDAVDRFDEAIEHATRLDCIDAFTIGFRNALELDQVAERIASTVMR